MKRRFCPITVFSICLVLNFMPPEASAQPTPKKGGMITVGINTDVTAVDPHVTTANVAMNVLNHVVDRLIGLGENLE